MSGVQSLANEILEKAKSHRKSFFSRDYWVNQALELANRNLEFKQQLFRFVDVLPSLNSADDVVEVWEAYFDPKKVSFEIPKFLHWGAQTGKWLPSLMAKTIRENVKLMARQFIVGDDITEALPTLKQHWDLGWHFTLDVVGELTLTEAEAFEYQKTYIRLIQELPSKVNQWPDLSTQRHPLWGKLPRVNLSLKLSALYPEIKEIAADSIVPILVDRLRPIIQEAQKVSAFINIDMEHYTLLPLTYEVFERLLFDPAFRSYPFIGIVLQAYLRDSEFWAQKLISWAKKRETPFFVRLVKGAYWDQEMIEAQSRSWPTPVFTQKKFTDAQFERLVEVLWDAYPHVQLACASHNLRSIAVYLAEAQKRQIPLEACEIQMLFGMAQEFKKALVEKGIRVRQYCPMGPWLPAMGYLVRRLLENTSNQGWLRQWNWDEADFQKLLASPLNSPEDEKNWLRERTESGLSAYQKPLEIQDNFVNTPSFAYHWPEVRQQLRDRIRPQQTPNWKCQPCLKGHWIKTSETRDVINPNNRQPIGEMNWAQVDHVDQAIEWAKKGFPQWAQLSFKQRAEYLRRVAQYFWDHKWEIMETQVWEVGKPWSEADQDVNEAIDFCLYYAQQAEEFDKPLKMAAQIPGEWRQYRYVPRGVTAIIAPWNFPLAILTGQTVAALVMGNPVIIKPAENSSVTGQWLARALEYAGVPNEVWHFMPGQGEVIGAHLVRHPDVVTIAFTGSLAVGLEIWQSCGKLQPGQKQFKRAILELGGKNAIIVDRTADWDQAISGILVSAFGFAGQKCSALSRLLVDEAIAEPFFKRLEQALARLKVGPSWDPTTDVPPVVSQEAYERLQKVLQQYLPQWPHWQHLPVPTGGYYVAPTLIYQVSPDHPLMQEEWFGPILCTHTFKTLEEALEIAQNVKYGLTGGLYSRHPGNIEWVLQNWRVGNLYINRKITGAMVNRHPFGGLNLSGVGSKTGGPDYLRQFGDPITQCENIIRKGFSPDLTV